MVRLFVAHNIDGRVGEQIPVTGLGQFGGDIGGRLVNDPANALQADHHGGLADADLVTGLAAAGLPLDVFAVQQRAIVAVEILDRIVVATLDDLAVRA